MNENNPIQKDLGKETEEKKNQSRAITSTKYT